MAGYNMSAGFEEVPQPGAVRCPHQLDADEVNRLNLAAIERLDRTDGCILSDRVGFIAVRRWRVGPFGAATISKRLALSLPLKLWSSPKP